MEEYDLVAQLEVEREKYVRLWYADIANYLVTKNVPANLSHQQKKKFVHDTNFYLWEELYPFNVGAYQIIQRCALEVEQITILRRFHESPYRGHFSGKKTAINVLQSGFFWPTVFKDVDT